MGVGWRVGSGGAASGHSLELVEHEGQRLETSAYALLGADNLDLLALEVPLRVLESEAVDFLIDGGVIAQSNKVEIVLGILD